MTTGPQRPLHVSVTAKHTGAYWVLVPDDDGDVAVVNAMGYDVFRLCDGSRTADAMAREITDATGADPDTVAADVTTYLTRLQQAGLLTTSRP